eukprot:756211-Hanusia_phi.AAC.8
MKWYLREIRARQTADSDESEESDYSSEGLSEDDAFPASPREVYKEVYPLQIIDTEASPSSKTDSSVLDRVRDMRRQMTGTNDEFVLLQGRVSRIAGYSQRLFGASGKTEA